MSNKLTAVIIQARYGSSRLPGKILEKIENQTVLAHVINRALMIPSVDKIICAIPDSKENESVAKEARKHPVEIVMGPENDVLGRYYQAATKHSVEHIVRITSDCPLIDPNICERVIQLFFEKGADYACNDTPPSFPHGLDCEVFSFEWLKRAAIEADKPSEREHVTQYIRNHPESKKVNLEGPGGEIIDHRWTLDTYKDLEFFQNLFKLIPKNKKTINYEALLSVLKKNPDLKNINAGQDRYYGLKKSINEDLRDGFKTDRIDPNLREEFLKTNDDKN